MSVSLLPKRIISLSLNIYFDDNASGHADGGYSNGAFPAVFWSQRTFILICSEALSKFLFGQVLLGPSRTIPR